MPDDVEPPAGQATPGAPAAEAEPAANEQPPKPTEPQAEPATGNEEEFVWDDGALSPKDIMKNFLGDGRDFTVEEIRAGKHLQNANLPGSSTPPKEVGGGRDSRQDAIINELFDQKFVVHSSKYPLADRDEVIKEMARTGATSFGKVEEAMKTIHDREFKRLDSKNDVYLKIKQGGGPNTLLPGENEPANVPPPGPPVKKGINFSKPDEIALAIKNWFKDHNQNKNI